MGAKKGDALTFKVGVARDKNQCPSEEEFKEGRRIASELEAREEARKKPKVAPKKEKVKVEPLTDYFRDMFKKEG